MGPTASGKTALALELAKYYPIEIVSVDSALIYTDMDIGTAKPTPTELTQAPHHLINIINPLQSYSVADFLEDSIAIAQDVLNRGKIPLFVGGSMMYFNALINGISELPASNPEIRAKLEEKIVKYGIAALYEELKQIDPISAKKIKSTDSQRIIRALEVCQLSSIPMSQLQQEIQPRIKHDLNFLGFKILPNNRELLHHRINQRFEQMLENGLIDEVCQIKAQYPDLTINHTSMRSVGYKQVWQYLDNEINQNELREKGQAATRQLAKRQITWLKNMNYSNIPSIINLNMLELEELFKEVMVQIKNH